MTNQHISFRKKQYASNAAAAADSSSNPGFIVFDSSRFGIYIDGKNYGSTMFGYDDAALDFVTGNVESTDTFLEAIKKIENKADAASSGGVQSFGTKTGAISIDTAASSNGSVQFEMEGSTLKGAVALPTELKNPNAVTFNKTGGANKGSSYDGSNTLTVSHSTVGALVEDASITLTGEVNASKAAFSNGTITLTTSIANKKYGIGDASANLGTVLDADSVKSALGLKSAAYAESTAFEPKFTDGSATPVSLSGTTLTMKGVTQSGGAIGNAASSTTIEFMTAPSSSNKVATAADIAGVTGAMHYKGTVNSTTPLPTTNVTQGDVYVVGVAGTYAGQACEVGDMIIAKTTKASGVANTDWNVINGENQVTNYDATVTAGGSLTKIATVDGTDIKIRIPNLDASYQPKFNDGSATVASMPSNTLVIKGVSQSGGTISATTTPDVSVYFASANSSTNKAMNSSDVTSAINTATGTADTADASDNGVRVQLTGTVKDHGLTVTVTDGSVASGETKLVTGATVYDAMSWETYE